MQLLVSILNASDHTKCISLSNQKQSEMYDWTYSF